VIVDGLVYDNSAAPVLREVAPGVDAVAEVLLGQRVSVDYSVAGVASTVHVDATLAGSVASVSSPGRFSILGQAVATNAVGSVGPITQFGGGYTQAADVRAGDPVEVHGILVRQNGTYSIQATRIDKLAAAPAYLRVTGLASNVAAASLTLGALAVDTSASTALPAGAAITEGQAVTVLALPASLTNPGNGSLRLKAAQTRVRQLAAGELDDYVSGSLSHLDATSKTFALGSLVVHYGNATLAPAGATLSEGLYVLVRGITAADGSLNASTVTLRNTGSDSEGELKGNISAYVVATKQFTVRGVSVDASAAAIQGCPATGLADGVFVEVQGALVSTGVMAKTVQCQSESSGSTVERSGVASAVDASAKSFTLTPKSGSAVAVKWGDSTFFGALTPQSLTGKTVQVEGQFSGSVLNASKIEAGD